jgi:hypothetical protein
MRQPFAPSRAAPLALMAVVLVTGLSAEEAVAQVETAVSSSAAASEGQVTEVRSRRRRATTDDDDVSDRDREREIAEEEMDEEEADERGDKQVIVVEQEDKFGPLYCAICSCLAPPLWPLWVILMIVVDNDVPPTHLDRRRDSDVPPSLKPMDERDNAMAVLY